MNLALFIVRVYNSLYISMSTTDDFQGATISISFEVGAPIGDEQCAAFGITDDNMMEPMESFMVSASGGEFVNGQISTQVVIGDNDGDINGERWLHNYS